MKKCLKRITTLALSSKSSPFLRKAFSNAAQTAETDRSVKVSLSKDHLYSVNNGELEVSMKLFDSIAASIKTNHPQLSERLQKEMNKLYKNHLDYHFKRSEIDRLKNVNKINEEKIKNVIEEIEIEEKELLEIKDRLQKEKEREKSFAITKVAKELLEIVDNLERSLKTIESEKQEFLTKTVRLRVEDCHDKIAKLLKEFGIVKMEGLVGKSVDLNFQEIAAVIPWPGKTENEVIDVIQTGYFIENRTLRAAKVVVIKNN